MSTYRVRGRLKYRGHPPGKSFIGNLDPDEEARALERGNIEIIQRGPIALDESRVRPPKGN